MQATIRRSTSVLQTARVKQASGLFDLPPTTLSEQSWDVSIDLPAAWNVGVIVGPSGSGKTTVARELFSAPPFSLPPSAFSPSPWPWPTDKSILDGFPPKMSIKDITGLLSSVGFSSPPAWLRPFHVLSNGQQFRVNLARTLAELPDLAVVDEFTSVVDRTVAQIGSAAVAKTVRRRNQKFIAVTCHYDVLDWLDPDWIYEPHTAHFELSANVLNPSSNAGPAGRGSVRRRPPIDLEIVRTDCQAWKLFKGHHYLSSDLHRASKCFVAMVQGQPAAFTAVLSFPHPKRPGWREHRTVCLPDFQGVGIGNTLSEFVASLFLATGKPYFSRTSHPSMIRHRAASRLWRMTQAPGLKSVNKGNVEGMKATTATDRLSAGFEYIGPPELHSAIRFGLL